MDPRQTAETFNTVQPLLFWLVAGLVGVCAIATVITQNIVRAATWLLFTLAGTSAIFFLLGADLVGATQLLVYVGGTLVLVIFGVMLTAQGPFISMKTSGPEWAISLVAGALLLGVLLTGIITDAELGPDNPAKRASEAVMKYSRASSRARAQVKAAEQPRQALKGAEDGPVDLEKGAPGEGDKAKPGGKKGQGGGKKGSAPGGGGPGGFGPPGGIPPDGGPPPGMQGEADKKDETLVEREPVPAISPKDSPQSAVLAQGFMGAGVGPAHAAGKERVVRTSYLLPFEIVSVHLLVVLIGAAYLARAKRRRGGES